MRTSSLALLVALAASACSKPPHVALIYELGRVPTANQVSVADVEQVVTTIEMQSIAGTTGDLGFSGASPNANLPRGVTQDVTADGALEITYSKAGGYAFAQSFELTLVAPSGSSPTLSVQARALDANMAVIGRTQMATVSFGAAGEIELDFTSASCGSGVFCTSEQLCCASSDDAGASGSACSTVASDPHNCGACGASCDGNTSNGCTQGSCTCNGKASCEGASTCCENGGCTDTMTDRDNCGACGHACGASEQCVGGQCTCGTNGATCGGTNSLCCLGASGSGTCGDPSKGCPCGASTGGTPLYCTSTQLCCNSTCVELSGTNCGACGRACGADELCCSGACTNDTSTSNCGACNNACGNNETCNSGSCSCGSTSANGPGDACPAGKHCNALIGLLASYSCQ